MIAPAVCDSPAPAAVQAPRRFSVGIDTSRYGHYAVFLTGPAKRWARPKGVRNRKVFLPFRFLTPFHAFFSRFDTFSRFCLFTLAGGAQGALNLETATCPAGQVQRLVRPACV